MWLNHYTLFGINIYVYVIKNRSVDNRNYKTNRLKCIWNKRFVFYGEIIVVLSALIMNADIVCYNVIDHVNIMVYGINPIMPINIIFVQKTAVARIVSYILYTRIECWFATC